MSKEKAIEYLDRLRDEVWNEDSDGYEYAQALDMAIAALRNEQKAEDSLLRENPDSVSNGDVIYRQKAIDIVRNRVKRYTTPCVLAVTDIENLPSAQPEQRWIPCGDCEKRCEKWENSKTSQE